MGSLNVIQMVRGILPVSVLLVITLTFLRVNNC